MCDVHNDISQYVDEQMALEREERERMREEWDKIMWAEVEAEIEVQERIKEVLENNPDGV